MDNHPIPQDVTGFQFRLIGNMTVKQFAYVAVGTVGAVIIYYLPLFILLKIILIPLFILVGVALAFLPVEGRPIDIMVTHFIKAIFAPTQFIYQKKGGQLAVSAIRVQQKAAVQAAEAHEAGTTIERKTQEQKKAERELKLQSYLNTIRADQDNDDQEAGRLTSLFGEQAAPTLPVQQPVVTAPVQEPTVPQQQATQPQPESPVQQVQEQPVVQQPNQVPAPTQSQEADNATLIQKDTAQLAQEDSLMTQVNEELTRAKAEEQSGTNVQAHEKVTMLEQKLQEIQAAKQKLEEELKALQAHQPARVVQTPAMPQTPTAAPTQQPEPQPVQQPQTPKAAPVANQAADAGFPSLPENPNILLGVVRDSSGNVLPHILVEVKDADDNPVRAFKTNQLGQFMSATPLKQGTYTISLEDSKNKYKFDDVSVTVNNQIMQPLVFAAHDLREELRKSLFA